MNERYAGSGHETIQLKGGSALTNLEVHGSQRAPQRMTSYSRSPPEMGTSSAQSPSISNNSHTKRREKSKDMRVRPGALGGSANTLERSAEN